MPTLKSSDKPMEPIPEELGSTQVIRSVQHFGGLEEVCLLPSDSSSHDSDDIENNISSSESDLKDMLEKDPLFCLTYFQSVLFATILEDVIVSLRILSECNNSLRCERVLDETATHLRKKYKIAPAAVQPSALDLIDPTRLYCTQYKMHKLENDRNDISDSMQAAYVGLTLCHSIRPLWSKCQEIMDRNNYVLSITERQMENKIHARTLHRQLRQQQVQQKSAKYDSNSLIDDKRRQIEDAELMSSIKERYAMKWQNARTEQHQKDISLKQEVYSGSIQYHKRRSEQESIVHSEIEMLMNVYIQETLQKIEDTMDKYEKDMESIDLKLQITMSDVNKITKENNALYIKFKSRDKEMKEWVSFKTERARQQKYHDDMTRCAVSVQAWWRGLLVRQQLGPFRVSKKAKPPIPVKPAKK